jgi:hypothetical protein
MFRTQEKSSPNIILSSSTKGNAYRRVIFVAVRTLRYYPCEITQDANCETKNDRNRIFLAYPQLVYNGNEACKRFFVVRFSLREGLL